MKNNQYLICNMTLDEYEFYTAGKISMQSGTSCWISMLSSGHRQKANRVLNQVRLRLSRKKSYFRMWATTTAEPRKLAMLCGTPIEVSLPKFDQTRFENKTMQEILYPMTSNVSGKWLIFLQCNSTATHSSIVKHSPNMHSTFDQSMQ